MGTAAGTPLGDLIRVADEACAALAAALPHSASPATEPDLLEAVSSVGRLHRLVETAAAVLAAEVEQRSLLGLGNDSLSYRHGFKRAKDLLGRLTRMPERFIQDSIRAGEAIAPPSSLLGEVLPPRFGAVADAAFAGEIGVRSTGLISRMLTQTGHLAPLEHVAAAEQRLVEHATLLPPELVDVHVRAWREALDQDGIEPREERQRRRRDVTLGRTREDGMTPLSGLLPPDAAALLKSAFTTFTNPRTAPAFLPTDDGGGDEASSGGSVLLDDRTAGQRRHDILTGLLTAGVRASTTGAGNMREITRVVATVTLDDLLERRGAGWLDDMIEPVSPTTVARFTCDAGYRKLILGENGDVLALGDRTEFFTPKQRIAIAARDGGCVNCGAPAAWSEIHHVQHRQHGGPTDVNNGVLLCSSCHHILHSGIIQVRMIDGVPHLKTRYDDTWKRAGSNRAHDTRRRQRGLSSVPAKDGSARASGAPPGRPDGSRPPWTPVPGRPVPQPRPDSTHPEPGDEPRAEPP